MVAPHGTLRGDGPGFCAVLSPSDPALRAALAEQGSEPATVLQIAVEEVFFQCARALMRSRLWGDVPRPAEVPMAGQFMQSATARRLDPVSYDREAPARLAQLY